MGGFSYADVLDSAKGWAATIKFNPKVGVWCAVVAPCGLRVFRLVFWVVYSVVVAIVVFPDVYGTMAPEKQGVSCR